MDAVEDVKVVPLTATSQFVKPLRMHYKQDKVDKVWDLVSLHNSVSVILFNTDRQKLIMVKQFRPAVYYNGVPAEERQASEGTIDTSKYPPGQTGLTLELCAGIVDKPGSLVEVARDEVLEECGYDVPLKNFEYVKAFRSGVGVSGDRQTMFYAEVTDKMKVTAGGGIDQELIEVVEMGVPEMKELLAQPEILSPAGFLFGINWFMQHKAPSVTTNTSS